MTLKEFVAKNIQPTIVANNLYACLVKNGIEEVDDLKMELGKMTREEILNYTKTNWCKVGDKTATSIANLMDILNANSGCNCLDKTLADLLMSACNELTGISEFILDFAKSGCITVDDCNNLADRLSRVSGYFRAIGIIEEVKE